MGWDCIKEYPLTSTIVSRPWKLTGKRARVFRPELTVEPDWPTHELLKIQAHINGREDLAPTVCIEVLPPEMLQKSTKSSTATTKPAPTPTPKAPPAKAKSPKKTEKKTEKKTPAPKPKPTNMKDVM